TGTIPNRTTRSTRSSSASPAPPSAPRAPRRRPTSWRASTSRARWRACSPSSARPEPVLAYVARRLASLIPLLAGMVVLGFAIIQLAPGDPVQVLVGDSPAPPEYVQQGRERFGLDRPVIVQLVRYAGQVLRGNLGHSFFFNEPGRALVLGPPLMWSLVGSAGQGLRAKLGPWFFYNEPVLVLVIGRLPATLLLMGAA